MLKFLKGSSLPLLLSSSSFAPSIAISQLNSLLSARRRAEYRPRVGDYAPCIMPCVLCPSVILPPIPPLSLISHSFSAVGKSIDAPPPSTSSLFPPRPHKGLKNHRPLKFLLSPFGQFNLSVALSTLSSFRFFTLVRTFFPLSGGGEKLWSFREAIVRNRRL